MEFAIFMVVVFIFFYFLPAFCAWCVRHRNLTAIFWLNLLLGWTLLGWVGALIWAIYKEKAVSVQV